MKTLIYLFSFLSCNAFAQQPSAILHDDWTGTNWSLWSGTDYFYDNNDLETTSISKYYYGSTDTWIDDERITAYYSPSGNQITARYYAQGIETFPDTTRRTLFEYNSFGQLTSETSQYYFPTYWQDAHRTIYTYTTSVGNVHTKQYEWWDNDLGQWLPISKSVYTYAANQSQYVYYVWDNSQWNIEGRTTVTFNQNNQSLEETYETWSGFYWNPGSKITYMYTTFGKLSDASTRYYSAEENGFISGDSLHYNYNTDHTINNTVYMNYDNQVDVWSNIRRDRYIYGSHLSITEETKTAFLVYPNPATDFISIDSNESGLINIIDAQGKLWKANIECGQGAIDIRDLPKGVYFIRLQTKDRILTQLFVKQ